MAFLKIKSKKGYNVIINDLNISLNSGNSDGVFVNKEDFDNSKEAIKFLDKGLIEIISGKEKQQKEETKKEVRSFVVDINEEIEKEVERVFIKELNEKETRTKVEQIRLDEKVVNEAKEEEIVILEVEDQKQEEIIEEEIIEEEKQEENTEKINICKFCGKEFKNLGAHERACKMKPKE